MADITDIVVGIDLGSSKSSIAVYLDGAVKILKISDKKKTFPSSVFFNEQNQCVFKPSEKNIADQAYPLHGISGIHRLIGRKFDDFSLQNNLQHLSFDVEPVLNNPVIVIDQPTNRLRRSPLEIYSCILANINEEIQEQLGEHNEIKVVITVPGHFDIAQREAILEAAEEVGFKVLKLLNKPTAIALSYFFANEKFDKGDYFLIYNLGSGSFNVAIYKMLDFTINTVAVIGNNFLGGFDIDSLILNFVCDSLKERYNFDVREDKMRLNQLRHACEGAKKALSDSDDFTIRANCIPNVDICDIRITKTQFEEMLNEFLLIISNMIDECLIDNNLSRILMKSVILSGGCSRIPKIKKVISDYFGEHKVNKFVYQDYTAVEGAAIQAAMLSTSLKQSISMKKIFDVTPYTIGVKRSSNLMHTLIKRNFTIPCQVTTSYMPVENKSSYIYDVYEGERADCRKNRYIKTVEFKNISVAPETKIQIMLKVDRNGMISFFGREKLKNRRKDLDVVYTKTETSQRNVRNTLIDACENADQDQLFLEFALQKQLLLNFCKNIIRHLVNKGSEKQWKNAYDFCRNAIENAKEIEINDSNKLKKLVSKAEIACNDVMLYLKQ